MKKIYVVLLVVVILLNSGCQEASKAKIDKMAPKEFPSTMVGTWQAPPGIQDVPGWQITFEKDGSISKIFHSIFAQPIVVSQGGIDIEGPDPNTYMAVVLGPVETEYDPVSKIIKARIVVDSYEMKFVPGSLKGRMIDTFIGKASEDGQTLQAEWRNYGWLEGATEPNIALIDKEPGEIIVFQKLHLSDPNIISQ
ncbi:MAG: hypothetical protein ABFD79_12020 [Phycisphaerales bacterium]